MARQQTSSRSLNATAGAILLSIGLLLLIANVEEVAGHLSNSFPSAVSSLSTMIDLGLAGLRTLQAYFFNHPAFQSGLRQMLVSFWPLTLVILGGVLLHDAFKGRVAAYRAGAGPSARGGLS